MLQIASGWHLLSHRVCASALVPESAGAGVAVHTVVHTNLGTSHSFFGCVYSGRRWRYSSVKLAWMPSRYSSACRSCALFVRNAFGTFASAFAVCSTRKRFPFSGFSSVTSTSFTARAERSAIAKVS